MEKATRGKRASENQKEYLINFLEENVDLANDKFVTADEAKFRDGQLFEVTEVDGECSGYGVANTREDIATTSAILGACTSAAATSRGIATKTRSRGRKRRAHPKNPQLEKFFKLEGMKLKVMELSNSSKREQIAALKEQTEAIRRGTLVKENIVAKLQDLINMIRP